jgi:subtilase family serine protease
VPKLAAGETRKIVVKNIVAKTRTPVVAGDSYNAPFLVFIDPKDKIIELEEFYNNYDLIGITVQRPNLALTSFAFDPTGISSNGSTVSIAEKGKYTLTFTVQNTGGVPSVASKATLWVAADVAGAAGKVLKTLAIPKLAPGESKTLVFKNLVAKRVNGASGIALAVELDRENKIIGEDKTGNTAILRATITAP